MPSFSFKRGKIRKPETWVVSDRKISGPDDQQMNFGDIQKAHFAYTPHPRQTISQLILKSDTDVIKLQCNSHPKSDSHRAFRDLVQAILNRIKAEAPNVMFLPPPANIVAMRLGQLSAIIPMGIALPMLGEFFRRGSTFSLGMGMFLIVLAAFMTWSFNPGKAKPNSAAETITHFEVSYGL